MKTGPGIERFDYVEVRFHETCIVEDVRELLDRLTLFVKVDGRTIAESPMWRLQVESFSTRFRLKLSYPLHEGQDVTAELVDLSADRYVVKGPMRIEAELALLGRFKGQSMRWLTDGKYVCAELVQ